MFHSSLTTIEKTFRVFRQSIYNESLLKLKELKKLSGELEIDQALIGRHRKGNGGWGSEGKSLVFGIYLSKKWQGHYISCIHRKHDTLIPLNKTAYKERFIVLYK